MRAGGVRVRNPPRWQAADMSEDIVRQRAAEIGQDSWPFPRSALNRSERPFDPRRPGIEPRRDEHRVPRRLDPDERKAVAVEMPPQGGKNAGRIDAYDVAQLAIGARSWRNRIDRPLGISRHECEHL